MSRGFILVSMAMFFISSTARADAWENLQLICKELRIPQIDQFIQTGRAWEKKEIDTQKDLGNLANNVCPAYLKNANAVTSVGVAPAKDTVTLEQYAAEQTRTFSGALDANAKGKSGQAYLTVQFNDLAKACARANVNFGNTLCGKYITNRYTFIKSELAKIERKALEVQKTCPQLAENIFNDSKLKRANEISQGQGSATPTRIPAGSTKAKAGQSTITGEIKPEPTSLKIIIEELNKFTRSWVNQIRTGDLLTARSIIKKG